jgi:F0F1-type ATP synthase epsilon subunit
LLGITASILEIGSSLYKRFDSLPGKIVSILDVDKHVWVGCTDGHVRIYDKEVTIVSRVFLFANSFAENRFKHRKSSWWN